MGNGIAAHLQPYSKMELDICPVSAGVQLGMQFFQVSGYGTFVGANTGVKDAGFPVSATLPSIPAGVFTTVSLPLSELGIPSAGNTSPSASAPAPYWIYKFGMQQHQGTAMNVYVRNVKFV